MSSDATAVAVVGCFVDRCEELREELHEYITKVKLEFGKVSSFFYFRFNC